MYTGTLLFFTIGWGEVFIIFVVVYLVFGPKRIPEMARKLGKIIYEVKKASSDITREINRETEILNSEIDAGTKKLNQDIDIVKKSFEQQTKTLEKELTITSDLDLKPDGEKKKVTKKSDSIDKL